MHVLQSHTLDEGVQKVPESTVRYNGLGYAKVEAHERSYTTGTKKD